jgi:hypothetical protein
MQLAREKMRPDHRNLGNPTMHDTALLVGHTSDTPLKKFVCSESYYGTKRRDMFSYTTPESELLYASSVALITIHDVPYVLAHKMVPAPLPPLGQHMGLRLFTLTAVYTLIDLQSVISIVHFVPDATITKKNIRIHSQYWLNEPGADPLGQSFLKSISLIDLTRQY